MMPRRLERLNEFLKQQISAMIPRLKEPRLGFMTVTGVELNPDLSTLRVFYSVFGSDTDKMNTETALKRAKFQIRHELMKLENLRRIPQIEFIYDSTPERADRIQRLLMQIDSERHENDHKRKKP
jgi:ribosome-binding factor A